MTPQDINPSSNNTGYIAQITTVAARGAGCARLQTQNARPASECAKTPTNAQRGERSGLARGWLTGQFLEQRSQRVQFGTKAGPVTRFQAIHCPIIMLERLTS
jgi:hypothetical protein